MQMRLFSITNRTNNFFHDLKIHYICFYSEIKLITDSKTEIVQLLADMKNKRNQGE